MKNSKKMFLVFRRVLIILLVVYLINYFAVGSGYYENEINRKTILTEEKIKEFEEDIKNNEYVDLKDYTTLEYVDTTSVPGNIGYIVSEGISDFVTNKAVKFFNFVGKLFS